MRAGERSCSLLGLSALAEYPKEMKESARSVLAGEYESGYSGEELTILDIGANVGCFSIWSHHRWPRSRIFAYEPNPETFAMLQSNVRALDVECINAAVYPSESAMIEFVSRYAGDGEAGVAECMRRTFAPSVKARVFEVPVLPPSLLPQADVVKIDVEGAEVEVLQHMNLSAVSLILLEYQNCANRNAVKAILDGSFEIAFEDEFSWDNILPGSDYRPDLEGDKFGHLFFIRRDNPKLIPDPQPPEASTAFRSIRQRLRTMFRC